MTDYRTDAHLVEILKLVEAEGGNISQTARKHGLDRSHLSQQVSLAKARGLTPKTIIKDLVPALETKIRLLERENASIKRDNLSVEEVRKTIYGLAEMAPDPPTWLQRERPPHLPGVPMTCWSDWHWAERVTRTQTGGANEFNRRIAKERVKLLVDHTIDLTMHHMVNPKYPGIVVCLGGDMITGNIHEELRETNEGTIQQALLEVQEQLIAALTLLADVFGHIFVPCVVGNHARGTVRPRMKDFVYESYEYNLYCQLEAHFKRAKDLRVQFHIPGEADAYFTVLGHRFALTHGDRLGVKGGDGIIGTIGPITRGVKKLLLSEAENGRPIDTVIICHYHTYIPRGDAVPAIVNGSLIGYNEFARNALRVPPSRPSQALWFIHEKHGFTAQWPVYLDKQRKSADSADWVKWEKRREA